MVVDTKLEREIVDFLAKDSTIDAMIDASERGRPAVEAIDADLIHYFGDKVRPNPVKQHIGRLVRPVMENQGFVPAKRRRPTRSVLFTSGTVYGLSRSIMDILEAHGWHFRADEVNREIQSAIDMVGGNRAFARRHTLFTWTEYPDIATAQAAGALAVFGIAVDQALTDVAKRRESARPITQLSGAKLALLRAHCPVDGPGSSSIDPGIRTVIKLAAICATGLTPSQVAPLLHGGIALVEGWMRKRRLYSVAVASGDARRLPLFQFDDTGRPIPNVLKVIRRIDRTIHPVGVFNWFTSPSPDLANCETDFEPISPRDWLLRGHPFEPVSRLAGQLAVGTPA